MTILTRPKDFCSLKYERHRVPVPFAELSLSVDEKPLVEKLLRQGVRDDIIVFISPGQAVTVIDGTDMGVGKMFLVVRFDQVCFVDYFAGTINSALEQAVIKVPGIQVLVGIGGAVGIIESFEDHFMGTIGLGPQAVGDFNVLVNFRIIVDNSTVPDGFSVEKNNEPVVDIPDIDPVLFLHIGKF